MAMVIYKPHSKSLTEELQAIAQRLVAPGRGILFSDQSPKRLDKMLKSFGMEACENKRIEYRNMLFSTKGDINCYISGVCIHKEVLDQRAGGGCCIYCKLRRRDILVGVRADNGLVTLSCSEDETTTQGLDGLNANCADYKQSGCDFMKWTAELIVSDRLPSIQAVMENTNTLAKFAALCQANHMVPILDVNIKSEGSSDLDYMQSVTEAVLQWLMKALADHHIILEGIILKLNTVSPGPNALKRASPGQVARATMIALRRTVPVVVPGIILRHEGKSDDKNMVYMNAIGIDRTPKPWAISFGIDTPMQAPLLSAWQGKEDNVDAAQKEFLQRAGSLSKCVLGQYMPSSSESPLNKCRCKRDGQGLDNDGSLIDCPLYRPTGISTPHAVTIAEVPQVAPAQLVGPMDMALPTDVMAVPAEAPAEEAKPVIKEEPAAVEETTAEVKEEPATEEEPPKEN